MAALSSPRPSASTAWSRHTSPTACPPPSRHAHPCRRQPTVCRRVGACHQAATLDGRYHPSMHIRGWRIALQLDSNAARRRLCGRQAV
eukprot:6180653-Pleurochrysis_carterae.AAC.2